VLRRNVLILQVSALGDFVLKWPLILALGRIHPQSRIIVVTHASKGALAEAALHVESADIEEGWHVVFSDAGKPPPERTAKLLEGAHAIYNFISSDDSTLNALAPHAQLALARCLLVAGQAHESDTRANGRGPLTYREPGRTTSDA